MNKVIIVASGDLLANLITFSKTFVMSFIFLKEKLRKKTTTENMIQHRIFYAYKQIFVVGRVKEPPVQTFQVFFLFFVFHIKIKIEAHKDACVNVCEWSQTHHSFLNQSYFLIICT